MKNKGFTLIELLAVIIILSIILLIAFASVGSVIKNSKNSLHDSQINQIEKAAEYYNNKEGLKDYDICINVSDLIDEGYIKQDEVKDPKSGENIEGSVNIKYNGKKYSYEYQEKVCYYTYINLLEDIAPTGLSEGDKYEYQVNDTDTFKFYVLSIEDNQVNLIMDRNICGSLDSNNPNNGKETIEGRTCIISWGANNNLEGPKSAMQGIYNATKNWINVPNMNLDYEDEGNFSSGSYGYGEISTTMDGIKITKKDKITEVTSDDNKTPVIQYEKGKILKARLPKLKEVYNEDGKHCTIESSSCPAWLTNGLDAESNYYPGNEHISEVCGYWTMSSDFYIDSYAIVVWNEGYVNRYTSYVNEDIGIRPVITVPMSTFINK